jgi:hypothetical protein
MQSLDEKKVTEFANISVQLETAQRLKFDSHGAFRPTRTTRRQPSVIRHVELCGRTHVITIKFNKMAAASEDNEITLLDYGAGNVRSVRYV